MRKYSPFEIMAARARDVFTKNRIDPEVKLLAALLYHLGLSYRRVSLAMGLFFVFSHESCRLWYRKIGSILPQPEKIHRSIIAVDETKLRVSGRFLFIWSAIDVERYEVLALKATFTRGELDSILFLKEALRFCSNRPLILVDHGPWYPPALEHLGLRYKQVTFGERNPVESWFNILKQKTKRFYNKFPFHSSMQSIASYLVTFVRMQNILTGKIT
jgi:putative transposase